MSSRLGTYFSIASISVFDFSLGISIAKITDYIFKEPNSNQSILTLLLNAVGQLVMAMTLSYELRGLLLTERKGFFDPTGGICFILAIHTMPTFWKRIDILVDKIMDYIFNPVLSTPQGADTTNGPSSQQALNTTTTVTSHGHTITIPTDVVSQVKQSAQGRSYRPPSSAQ